MSATDLLMPVYRDLTANVLSSEVVHTDDTAVPVLDHDRATRDGHLWVYVGDQTALLGVAEASSPQRVKSLLASPPSKGRYSPQGRPQGDDHRVLVKALKGGSSLTVRI